MTPPPLHSLSLSCVPFPVPFHFLSSPDAFGWTASGCLGVLWCVRIDSTCNLDRDKRWRWNGSAKMHTVNKLEQIVWPPTALSLIGSALPFLLLPSNSTWKMQLSQLTYFLFKGVQSSFIKAFPPFLLLTRRLLNGDRKWSNLAESKMWYHIWVMRCVCMGSPVACIVWENVK